MNNNSAGNVVPPKCTSDGVVKSTSDININIYGNVSPFTYDELSYNEAMLVIFHEKTHQNDCNPVDREYRTRLATIQSIYFKGTSDERQKAEIDAAITYLEASQVYNNANQETKDQLMAELKSYLPEKYKNQ